MLVLLFHVEEDIYAIDARYIVEIFPKINIQKIPQAPDYVLGYAYIEAKPITVLDFTQILAGRPSSSSMHTRIVLLSLDVDVVDSFRFAIVAEKAIEIIECEQKDFVEPTLKMHELEFLDGVMQRDKETIQLIDVKKFFLAMQEKYSDLHQTRNS